MDNVRRTLYDDIGVAPSATVEAIKEACLRLEDECRTDTSLDAKTAAHLLANIGVIRTTLSDPERRRQYDAELAHEIDWDKRAQNRADAAREKKREEKPPSAPKYVAVRESLSERGPLVALGIVAAIVGVLALGAAFDWYQEHGGADRTIPRLQARVTDLTGTLEAQQSAELERMLVQFEARKGSQLAVLIVPSTRPETIEQYAVRVEEVWKLGRKGIDDGVLLVVAKDDRRLRIEVGYGLEGVLTDAVAKRIIVQDIAPRFKLGDFYGGIRAGAERIIRVIDGEKLAPTAVGVAQSREQPGWFSLVGIYGFLICVFFIYLIACVMTFLGQFLGAVATSGAVGYYLFDVHAQFFENLFFSALAFAISFLIFPWTRDFWRDFWSSIFSWDGGSSGGGGGGGFSGGGGSSGGGGASGSW